MKTKLLLLIVCLFSIANPAFHASEQKPDWIRIKYSDLEQKKVSEYQLVTVTVTQKSPWFTNVDSSVDIDYDENVLELAKVTMQDESLNVGELDDTSFSTNLDEYQVKYQFYLKPNVSVETTPITITKHIGDKTEEVTINLDCYSYTMKRNVSFGNTILNYIVSDYTNNGAEITLKADFEVIANPDDKPILATLKENNMSVSSTDDYKFKASYSGSGAEAVDKNNIQFDLTSGDTFTITITANVGGLSAKDDRFEFFLFLSDGANSVRLEPTFFRSETISSGANAKVMQYSHLKMLINIFFVLLLLIYIIKSRRFKQLEKPKTKVEVTTAVREDSDELDISENELEVGMTHGYTKLEMESIKKQLGNKLEDE